MRTTIDLPSELFHRAKVAAAERGATLKELVSRALERELQRPSSASAPQRAQFPIFNSRAPGTLKLGADEIRRLEDEEEARSHGFPD